MTNQMQIATLDRYLEVKAYAVKRGSLGFIFFDASPNSPIGRKALELGEFKIERHGKVDFLVAANLG